MMTWRRSTGEFPHSGTISQPRADTHVAWVGQVFDDHADQSREAIARVASDSGNDAELASMNGPFAAAMIASGAVHVRVVLDRYRHVPVYLHRGPDYAVVSTDLGCILAWMGHAEIDRDSLDMLLRTGELIDRGTIVRGVELLPPATVIEARGVELKERAYWRFEHRPDDTMDMEATARTCAEAMTRAVRRIERVSPRLAVTLSGGLDSRLIHGLCQRRREIPAFTWGLAGCRDITCAAAFAKRIGAPHTVRHWEVDAYPPLWTTGADLTAGTFGIESMHMLPFVSLLAEHADVVLNGLAGDVLLGGNFVKLAWIREPSLEALAYAAWRWRVPDSAGAWAERILGSSKDGSRTRWVASIAAHSGSSPAARLNDWLYPNRVFRYTNSGTMLLRWGVESHAPFWDNDLVDLLLRVPLPMKLKHRLYLRVMKLACPDAAATPWQRTMLPPAWGFWANGASMAFQKYSRAIARKVGVQLYAADAVADVSGWMRGPWSSSLRELLLGGVLVDQRMIDRGELERMLQDHASGANHTRTIGVLTAAESFARTWRLSGGVRA